ncbi:hypothetical protein [Kordiimonas marina]|uniref:hypothetical protein n=1 Tax=Kordiimonas marina TaxID=2872312 RepID=UPI001FF2A0C6|nr:hypothetical protein [Kordiimonas marina]MCJ9427448.1 hypothetical protein [Kordiimonas marina]
MKTALVILVAILGIAMVAYYNFHLADQLGDVKISSNGMAAMAGGLIMTFLVGVGLMSLLFFSARRGHDEEVHNLNKKEKGTDEADKDEAANADDKTGPTAP